MIRRSVRAAAAAAALVSVVAGGAAQAAVADMVRAHCYARSYTPAHLRANPDQTVRSFYLGPASPAAQRAARGRIAISFGMRLIGRPGPYSGMAECRPHFDTLRCGVEGDGGTFVLSQMPRGRLQVVVERLEVEGSRDFSGNIADGDNLVMLLFPAPRGACPRG